MKKLISALALIALVSGCGVPPPIQGRSDPYAAPQVNFTAEDLRTSTAVSAPQVSRDESNLLLVTIPIRSTIDKTLYTEYRVTFFDRNHQVINQTSWLRKDLAPNVNDQITFNSSSPRAADFQIDIRWGTIRKF